MPIVKLVRLCRVQCLRLITGSHEGEHANTTMNQKNILPYDGFAYLVNDTNGEFEWPGITACLAEIIPWRIESARLFGRDVSVPRMTAWFGDADYAYSGIRHRAEQFPGSCSTPARTRRSNFWRIVQRGPSQSLSKWRRQCRLA
jgi:hypothetical protein